MTYHFVDWYLRPRSIIPQNGYQLFIIQIIQMSMTKYVTSQEGPESKTQVSKEIDWNHFNYPPLLSLFHYSRDKIPQNRKTQITLLWVVHILITLSMLLNFITNIIATAQGDQGGGIRIGITVFLSFLWLPLGLYVFYLPYMLIMKDEGSTMVFYGISVLTIVWFFIWSIANFADANGFVRAGEYFKNGYGAAGAFSVITSIINLVISLLTIANTILFCRN